MEAVERRNEILRLLCQRRFETTNNLAFEFKVSAKTIRRDIEELSLFAPIYTKPGKHNGGIYVMEGYAMDRMYMRETEIQVLEKILMTVGKDKEILSSGEREILESIISVYSNPKRKKGK
ncbi:MAG: DeoR family transcriptional regulator [Lachnospiraceae bacterium]|nr:DeoR family transcriptional regulator [Lachnospiraceae bacterium]